MAMLVITRGYIYHDLPNGSPGAPQGQGFVRRYSRRLADVAVPALFSLRYRYVTTGV